MKHLSALLLLIMSLASYGQDAHFTHYYQVPGQYNPALTGTFGGLYRVGINYRDQWRRATPTPMTTMAASGDVKFYLGANKGKEDIFALGIMFLSDRVNTIDFNTTSIGLTGSYHKMLDKNTKQYIGAGAQFGITQRNTNFEDLTFQDQFNAIDGYDGSTLEDLPVNNFGNFDLNMGVTYSIAPAKRTKWSAGASLYHITNNNVSFFEKTVINNDAIFKKFPLQKRINIHTSYETPIAEYIIFNPRALYAKQGQHNMLMVSSLFKLRNKYLDDRSFMFGPTLRLNNDMGGFNLESIVLQSAIDYNGLVFGLSYDHNVQDLFNQRSGLGTFEISLTFLGEYINEDTFCPTF